MSTHSDPSIDFDLWDIVCCSKCLLPFISKAAPTIPFWLTECGHILCNNHLNPDRNCSHCGALGIQLVPLQKEMEAPMSDWFRAIPLALDSVAYSVKFQQEMMAAQIMSLRSRCQQQRIVIDRLKAENINLKKINEELTNVDSGLQYRTAITEYSSESINSNGKRPWNVPHQSAERISQSSTAKSFAVDSTVSERSLFSRQQNLSGDFPPQNEYDFYGGSQHGAGDPMHEVVKTDQLTKQYAYRGPPTLRYKPPPLSRVQAAPLVYQQRSPYPHNPPVSAMDNNQNNFAMQMRPPSRFRPAKNPHNSSSQAVNVTTPSKFQRAADQEVKRMRTMGPPPPPQGLRPQKVQDVQQSNPSIDGCGPFPSVVTNRFLPSSKGHVSNTPTPNNRLQPTPLNGKSQHVSHKTTNLDISGRTINPRKDNAS